jgi:hypothetical protein
MLSRGFTSLARKTGSRSTTNRSLAPLFFAPGVSVAARCACVKCRCARVGLGEAGGGGRERLPEVSSESRSQRLFSAEGANFHSREQWRGSLGNNGQRTTATHQEESACTAQIPRSPVPSRARGPREQWPSAIPVCRGSMCAPEIFAFTGLPQHTNKTPTAPKNRMCVGMGQERSGARVEVWWSISSLRSREMASQGCRNAGSHCHDLAGARLCRTRASKWIHTHERGEDNPRHGL